MNTGPAIVHPPALHAALLEELRTSGAVDPALRILAPLQKPAVADSADDAPSRSLVLDEKGTPVAVLAVSSAVDPAQVERSVRNAARAKEALGPNLGSVILDTLAQGTAEGLSYALWPWRRGLSDNRGIAFAQKRRVRPHVLQWLREATGVTRRAVPEEGRHAYHASLDALAPDGEMPEELRTAAATAQRRLADGKWSPASVLEHGDFWLGNVLFPTSRFSREGHTRGFVLIDWAGARLQGYPFSDLLRLADSSGLTAASLRREILSHCQTLGCEPDDAYSYLLTGFGALGQHLGCFPRERYRTMAQASWRLLAAALPEHLTR